MYSGDGAFPQRPQVVVVGAGIAGLRAAYELNRRGVDVVVVEAAGRVGGRVHVETTSLGSSVDLGGQWIGKGHHRFEALAAELGATQFQMRSPKRPTIADDDGEIRALGSSMLAANIGLVGLELASYLPSSDSQNTTTVQQWLDRIPSERARRILDVVLEVICCADVTELSVTALLAFIRYQGGLSTMMKTTGGAQDSMLVEGAGSLAERLAAKLDGRVWPDSAVSAIVQGSGVTSDGGISDGGVTVTTERGAIVADKVVVTVPPPLASRIAVEPALPESRLRLQNNTYMGSVYKALAVYETPFWRDQVSGKKAGAEGIDGEQILLGDPGCATFDSSPPDGPGHLTILVGGADARRLGALTVDERPSRLFSALERHLGPRVRDFADWRDKVWHHDEWVGGGYAALPRLGTREGFYPVEHAPVGNIHWAGTETASEHAGYIEGALESAERVVGELAAAGFGADVAVSEI
ncbi:flavin monoamine oxidase family protein [Gordonia sputi]